MVLLQNKQQNSFRKLFFATYQLRDQIKWEACFHALSSALTASAFHSWNILVQNTKSCHIFISSGERDQTVQTLPSISDCNWLPQAITQREKGIRGKNGVGRKGLINLSISNMFKVYKQSWFEKLHFQNTVTFRCLFIWLTVKTNIKSHRSTTETAIYLLDPFCIYKLYSGRKKKNLLLQVGP